MRVHLIHIKTVRLFVDLHPSSKLAMEEWLANIKGANWSIPADIIRTFNSADLLGNGSSRVIFNIGGNNYRIICKYAFGENQIHLFVCWIGTHDIYNRLCKKNKQYIINLY